MKSIMISIQPQWVEKILNGEKTLEIRKTMPKCELPVKVYIYCTNGKMLHDVNRKVVAEFTLRQIDRIEICDPDILVNDVLVNGKVFDIMEYKKNTCLSFNDFMDYIGYGDYHDGWGRKEWSIGYAWHIDDLKIYDKPKELSEFTKPDYFPFEKPRLYFPTPIRKPPQSWFYCDELEEV